MRIFINSVGPVSGWVGSNCPSLLEACTGYTFSPPATWMERVVRVDACALHCGSIRPHAGSRPLSLPMHSRLPVSAHTPRASVLMQQSSYACWWCAVDNNKHGAATDVIVNRSWFLEFEKFIFWDQEKISQVLWDLLIFLILCYSVVDIYMYMYIFSLGRYFSYIVECMDNLL